MRRRIVIPFKDRKWYGSEFQLKSNYIFNLDLPMGVLYRNITIAGDFSDSFRSTATEPDGSPKADAYAKLFEINIDYGGVSVVKEMINMCLNTSSFFHSPIVFQADPNPKQYSFGSVYPYVNEIFTFLPSAKLQLYYGLTNETKLKSYVTKPVNTVRDYMGPPTSDPNFFRPTGTIASYINSPAYAFDPYYFQNQKAIGGLDARFGAVKITIDASNNYLTDNSAASYFSGDIFAVCDIEDNPAEVDNIVKREHLVYLTGSKPNANYMDTRKSYNLDVTNSDEVYAIAGYAGPFAHRASPNVAAYTVDTYQSNGMLIYLYNDQIGSIPAFSNASYVSVTPIINDTILDNGLRAKEARDIILQLGNTYFGSDPFDTNTNAPELNSGLGSYAMYLGKVYY